MFGKCILDSISAHSTAWSLGGAYVASAFVTALPVPGSPEPLRLKLYRFVYDAAHTLVNSIPSKYRPPVPPEHL